jgi:hypothetical protein
MWKNLVKIKLEIFPRRDISSDKFIRIIMYPLKNIQALLKANMKVSLKGDTGIT